MVEKAWWASRMIYAVPLNESCSWWDVLYTAEGTEPKGTVADLVYEDCGMLRRVNPSTPVGTRWLCGGQDLVYIADNPRASYYKRPGKHYYAVPLTMSRLGLCEMINRRKPIVNDEGKTVGFMPLKPDWWKYGPDQEGPKMGVYVHPLYRVVQSRRYWAFDNVPLMWAWTHEAPEMAVDKFIYLATVIDGNILDPVTDYFHDRITMEKLFGPEGYAEAYKQMCAKWDTHHHNMDPTGW